MSKSDRVKAVLEQLELRAAKNERTQGMAFGGGLAKRAHVMIVDIIDGDCSCDCHKDGAFCWDCALPCGAGTIQ